jgi:hypothetical protein
LSNVMEWESTSGDVGKELANQKPCRITTMEVE